MVLSSSLDRAVFDNASFYVSAMHSAAASPNCLRWPPDHILQRKEQTHGSRWQWDVISSHHLAERREEERIRTVRIRHWFLCLESWKQRRRLCSTRRGSKDTGWLCRNPPLGRRWSRPCMAAWRRWGTGAGTFCRRQRRCPTCHCLLPRKAHSPAVDPRCSPGISSLHQCKPSHVRWTVKTKKKKKKVLRRYGGSYDVAVPTSAETVTR